MDVAHGHISATLAAVLSVSGKVGDAAVTVGYRAFAVAVGAWVCFLDIVWLRIRRGLQRFGVRRYWLWQIGLRGIWLWGYRSFFLTD